jgi:hypothetical protein
MEGKYDIFLAGFKYSTVEFHIIVLGAGISCGESNNQITVAEL